MLVDILDKLKENMPGLNWTHEKINDHWASKDAKYFVYTAHIKAPGIDKDEIAIRVQWYGPQTAFLRMYATQSLRCNPVPFKSSEDAVLWVRGYVEGFCVLQQAELDTLRAALALRSA